MSCDHICRIMAKLITMQRTFRQRSCNQRVGCLQYLRSRALRPAKRSGLSFFFNHPLMYESYESTCLHLNLFIHLSICKVEDTTMVDVIKQLREELDKETERKQKVGRLKQSNELIYYHFPTILYDLQMIYSNDFYKNDFNFKKSVITLLFYL